jgi:hypothetical protein
MFISISEESADSIFTAILKMDAEDYSKTLITANQTMQRLIPEDRNFVSHSRENFKYHLPVAVNDGTSKLYL